MQNVKYGFALGGGGTRAYSQIGAMAYLEEKGIKPTFISGTSMGAIHALLLGMGFNVQGICDFYRNKSAFSLFELSIGKNYLISNKKLGRVIKKICEAKGFKNLEDLPIKTAICVTDAKTNQPVFLSKGDIVEAILATTATYQTQMFDVQDEVIKKQVCQQTGQTYFEGIKILLKDGCYGANVPFEGLDLLRDNKDHLYYDFCFDVVPYYKKSIIKSFDTFNLNVFKNDQKRKEKFLKERKGCYMEFNSGLSSVAFGKKYLHKGITFGKKVTESYIKNQSTK